MLGLANLLKIMIVEKEVKRIKKRIPIARISPICATSNFQGSSVIAYKQKAVAF
jgi:hypothetical protein